MSVASKNPFALLNDDEGGDAPAAVTPGSKGATNAPAAKTQSSNRARGSGPASRGGRYYQRGGGAKAPPVQETAEVEGKENTGAHFNRTEGREGGRGRGRGRGRGGERGRGRGGGRTFDRHSATGIVDSDKQINQGWGADTGTAELQAETSAVADAAAEQTTTADWGAPADGDAAAADWTVGADAAGDGAAQDGDFSKKAQPEEEVDNTLTLDEYLAKKADSALSSLVGTLGPRTANEGATDDLFKGAQKLVKGEEEEAYFAGKGKAAPKVRAKKEEKVTIEIDGQFADARDRGGRGRGRGGGGFRGDRGGDRDRDRGDRGSFRGGGGRGRGGRGGFGNRNAGVDVADESAFPTLA